MSSFRDTERQLVSAGQQVTFFIYLKKKMNGGSSLLLPSLSCCDFLLFSCLHLPPSLNFSSYPFPLIPAYVTFFCSCSFLHFVHIFLHSLIFHLSRKSHNAIFPFVITSTISQHSPLSSNYIPLPSFSPSVPFILFYCTTLQLPFSQFLSPSFIFFFFTIL